MDAISCLAPPALHMSSSYPYTDAAAIARALHFSTATMSTDSSSSSSSLSHDRSPLLTALPSPYYVPPPVPPPHAATCCDSVLVADSPPRRRSSPTTAAPPGRHNNRALAPAGARAGKRRSRASKSAPTTYISTDAANFRVMVQRITGVQADAASGDAAGLEMAMLHVQQAAAVLDAAALLGAAGSASPQLLTAGDEASAVRHHQLQLQLELQQQPYFPTLDSWNVSNVMYETNGAEML